MSSARKPQHNQRLSIFNKLKDIDTSVVGSLTEDDNKLRNDVGWEKIIWSACGIK